MKRKNKRQHTANRSIRKSNKKKVTKKEDFFDRVYKVVAKIPYGKVTTYGYIAEVCGIRSSSRTVGWALNGAKTSGLPCHRVVNRFGALTGKHHFGDPHLMEDLLRSEGVEFDKDGCVILDKFLWIPSKMRIT
jgi:methylated-DNA-protein-cysteine methyltransferase-like protein